jgi:hypothetical protein
MKVNFDNMRVQTVENYNRIVSGLNAHIEDGDLRMNEDELSVLGDHIDALRMNLVCLAYLSGDNETFGEVGNDDMKFLSLNTVE